VNFLIAIALGALVGLEREIAQIKSLHKEFAGLRTFILISLVGATVGYLSNVLDLDVLLAVALFGFILLSIAGYVVTSIMYKKAGATTEIAAFLVFLLGVMTTTGFREYAVIFTILATVVLSTKPILIGLVKKIEHQEIYSTLQLAVISLVVLPFLPNQNFSPLDLPIVSDILRVLGVSFSTVAQLNVFNPYKIWLMVVFISALSYVGYILIKTIDTDKGIGITGVLGGLVSSTAVTTSLAAETKRIKVNHDPFVIGVVLASSIMFIRVLLEVLVVNSDLLKFVILPIGLMALAGFISALIIWNFEKKDRKQHIEFESPFTLGPALKFSVFFAAVLFFSKLGQLLYGSKGIYLASALSGLVDVDAITLSMSSLAASGDITSSVAVTAITIAVASNTVVKGGIAYMFGAKQFGMAVIKVFSIILLIGLGSTLLL
jgi:uncharacterized membrane protein (DUF4010 family)